MELLRFPELGKTFFINDTEYIVNFMKIGSGKFSADPHTTEGTYLPQINDKFMIDGCSYIVTYVHDSKRRITARPLSNGY